MGELALALLLHAALGLVLAAFVWRLGAGWTRDPRSALAYPAGLLALTAASFLVLASLWLLPLALALVAPVLAGRGLALGPLLRAAPFGLALGGALGGLLHGPTAERDSHAYGDLLFYAAKLVSARESVLPFRDLLVEGTSSTYVESASSLLGAALPGFDPILFQAATMPAFLVGALALGAGALGLRTTGAHAALLVPLGAAVVAYPTWITESPPVALAVPLAFSLHALIERPVGLAGLARATLLLGPAFALTKGFGVVPLATAVGYALAVHHRASLDARRLALVGAPVALAAAAAAAFFFATSGWLVELLGAKFLPADAARGLADQLERRDTQAAAPAILVAGELLLAALLARARAWGQLAALVAAVAGTWLVGGHGFDITVALAVVLALLRLAERPVEARAHAPLLVAAGLALAGAAVFRDISGVRAGAVFVVLLAGGIVAALLRGRALGLATALAAVAAGALLAVGGPDLAQGPPTLTPSERELWRQVREHVPADGLVFTSETGPEITGREGWNYYPGIAGRQVYLAGWSSSPLLVDAQERRERLAANRAVLSGEREPESIELEREYGSFYAAVRRDGAAPPSWRRLFANDAYALYELP